VRSGENLIQLGCAEINSCPSMNHLVGTRSTRVPNSFLKEWDAGGTRPYQSERRIHGKEIARVNYSRRNRKNR
jgi:hypothetical protein